MRIKSIQAWGRPFFLRAQMVVTCVKGMRLPLSRIAIFVGATFSLPLHATVAVPQPLPAATLPSVANVSASGAPPATIPALPAPVTGATPLAAASLPPAPQIAAPTIPALPAAVTTATPLAAASLPAAPQIAAPVAGVPAVGALAPAPNTAGLHNATLDDDDDDDDDDDEMDEDAEEDDEDEDGEDDTKNSRRGKSNDCACPVTGKDRAFITALRKNAMALEPVTRASRRFNDDWPDENRSAAAMVSEQEATRDMGGGAAGFFDALLGFAGNKLEEKLSNDEDDEDDEDEAI